MVCGGRANSREATKKRLDQYLVSVEELERKTGEMFPESPEYTTWEKPPASWLIPRGGNKG
jgi:endonuclease G